MSDAAKITHLKAAPAPEPRTLSVRIEEGPFAGWAATITADFRAGVWSDLDSGKIERIFRALDEIIIDHNMPDREGRIAQTISDVAPYDGALALATEIVDKLRDLPGR